MKTVAPQGAYQHDWEPPRTIIDDIPNRSQRIGALGNAVVPQVVAAVGECLWNFHIAQISTQTAVNVPTITTRTKTARKAASVRVEGHSAGEGRQVVQVDKENVNVTH